jgi:hypothetical protein
VEKELLTLLKNPSLRSVFIGILVYHSKVFCVVFCRPLYLFLRHFCFFDWLLLIWAAYMKWTWEFCFSGERQCTIYWISNASLLKFSLQYMRIDSVLTRYPINVLSQSQLNCNRCMFIYSTYYLSVFWFKYAFCCNVWLLFKSKWAIFQLYHGDNKLIQDQHV